jgi:hypothetical protein
MRYLRLVYVCCLFLFLWQGNMFAADGSTSSVLATGKWKKISVDQSGIYKLNYNDLVSMGMDPSKVQIYGYGGKLLSENFALNDYSNDLPEVPVYEYLGADGVFNAGDYLLFYAQGPISWSYNSAYGMYTRTRNHYSDKAYYFIGEREAGTLTATVSSFQGTANKTITSFTDFVLHESENVNIGESVVGKGTGRNLYGEDFTSVTSREFTFQVENPDTLALSKVLVEFIANNPNYTYSYVYVNDQYASSIGILPVSTSDEYRYAYNSYSTSNFYQKTGTLRVKLTYSPDATNSKSRAYLDYIILNLRRKLSMVGSTMPFRDPSSVVSGSIGRFQISEASSELLVFDVTQPESMIQMNGTWENGVYSFVNTVSTLRNYVAVDATKSIPVPTIEGDVSNQNLHGKSGLDMVVVAPSEFTSYARTLAEAHAQYDGLTTLIVTPEQVYNEFSSGTPDATAIRRMMKWFRDNPSASGKSPELLLLFGDGIYDNRWVTKTLSGKAVKTNKLLTFQSVESLNGLNSYVTDDYFGFLDSNEGSNLSTATLDIGVGRFPVSTQEEARIAVEKTIGYMKNLRKGTWKNHLLFLADNGDSYTHEKHANELAERVNASHPEFMISKIFLDTYTSVTTASGTTMPDANAKFEELLNDGILMLNYSGHGSTLQWAEEKLLMSSDIPSMTNKCLPLWVTATCDFTRYDDKDKSGGELVFLQENGGGVALVTTSRVVNSFENLIMNRSFIDNVFKKNSGTRLTLGAVMSESKCSSDLSSDGNKLKFTLIGDPALKLSYPEFSAEVTEIENHSVDNRVDTLNALKTVTVKGKIYKPNGDFASDFNGLVMPTVLDASEVIAKLEITSGDTLTVSDRSKVLFSGRDSVVGGSFSFSFVVPLDNSYSYKNGRINLYAYSTDGTDEAQGNFDGFVLGGTDPDAVRNSDGPSISLYLNDFSFTDGGAVGDSPTFLARISDENGLNTSGNGIGHDLLLTVDGNSSLMYNLNSEFTYDVGSYSSGAVAFQLPELGEGQHQLTFKAWDVQNNSSVETLNFIVRKSLKPDIADVQFAQSGGTGLFRFVHDRPLAKTKVLLSIIDLTGKIVWEKEWSMIAENNYSDVFEWDLNDSKDRRVANGIYICRFLFTDSNGAQSMGSKKIAVTGQ